MGTEITLEVGGLTLDWCKNSRGLDHGMLFQAKDRKRIHSDQVNYDYFREHDEDPGPMEMAFCRPLKEVVPRIEPWVSPSIRSDASTRAALRSGVKNAKLWRMRRKSQFPM